MDPLFVGVIFSVFQNDTRSNGNHVQLTCFQTLKRGSEYQRREIDVEITEIDIQKYNLKSISRLPRILSQEEVQRNEGDGDSNENELSKLHNDALETLALVHIVSKVSKPLCEDFHSRFQSVKLRIKHLERIKKQLI